MFAREKFFEQFKEIVKSVHNFIIAVTKILKMKYEGMIDFRPYMTESSNTEKS